jgi:phosphoribosylanthranilate isomerase
LRVKICGITNYEDAKDAIDFGADALGFVFYEKSPRYIKPDDAKKLIEKLPPFVEMVGLFVNEPSCVVNTIASLTKITLAQIHFEVSKSFYDELNIRHIKVVRAKEEKDIINYQNECRIVDAFVKSYGGEGKRVNLEWFKDKDRNNIILAGGLNEKNLPEVLKYNFYGVDVSSGVEKSKGKKDKMLLKNFIEIAKNGKVWKNLTT